MSPSKDPPPIIGNQMAPSRRYLRTPASVALYGSTCKTSIASYKRMKHAGGTFSGFKAILCMQEFSVVGHRCTPRSRIPDQSHIVKIANWGPCRDLSDV